MLLPPGGCVTLAQASPSFFVSVTHAAGGSEAVIRFLLAAAPQTAAAVDLSGCTPLHRLAGHEAASEAGIALLLAAAPAAVAALDAKGCLPLHHAVSYGSPATVRAVLAAASPPATASRLDGRGFTPLHLAALRGSQEVVGLLLEAEPEAAAVAGVHGKLPLHLAAEWGHEGVAWQLLAAAPAAATTADASGSYPLHLAAESGHHKLVKLLLGAAPSAASASNSAGLGPLGLALAGAAGEFDQESWYACQHSSLRYVQTAQLLLAATQPASKALEALKEAGQVALPLYVDVVAGQRLHSQDWEAIPRPCVGLRRALPAVQARSEPEAACLVRRLGGAARSRLHDAALCLACAQQQVAVPLPAAILGHLLALSVS